MQRCEHGFEALHGLRLRGFAPAASVAELVGAPLDQIETALHALGDQGLVVERHAPRPGWVLTPAGRTHHEHLAAAELDTAGVREPLEHLYEAFGPLNQAFLALCTRWQVRPVDGAPVVNDHLDPAYDQAVIDDLAGIDAEIQPLVAKVTALLDRFEIHGPRLANALAALVDGDYDWLADPLVDSYHTVWFELHEDLLVTLGLDRATETSTPSSPDASTDVSTTQDTE